MTDTKKFPSRFNRFLLVGGTGFVSDVALLSLFLHAGLGAALSRGPSIFISLVITFTLNKKFAFNDKASRIFIQFLFYLFVSSGGALTNFIVYLALISLFEVHPLVAMVAASMAALIINFLGYDRLVFRGPGKSK